MKQINFEFEGTVLTKKIDTVKKKDGTGEFKIPRLLVEYSFLIGENTHTCCHNIDVKESLFDSFQLGMNYKFHCNLDGRKYTTKTGDVSAITNIKCWRFEKITLDNQDNAIGGVANEENLPF